jgi:hypothetical protein
MTKVYLTNRTGVVILSLPPVSEPYKASFIREIHL